MNFFEKNEFLWEKLSKSDKPIVVYGTGDGADKLFALFERYDIKISGLFASSGFVRDRSFHGFKVRSYEDVTAEFPDCIVLLSFAVFRDDMVERIIEISKEREIYAPDMPLFGGDILDKQAILDNKNSILSARERLADEQSKYVFDCILQYKYTGEIKPLLDCETEREEAFGLLNLSSNPTFLDLGAYDGDTAIEFSQMYPDFKGIVAVEPDAKNYKKLLRCPLNDDDRFTAINKAVWSHYCELDFSSEGSRNSHASSGNENKVLADSIDNFACLLGSKVDYVKMDVEGAEFEAISGMQSVAEQSPAMCVSAYHKTNDFFDLVNLLGSRLKDSKIYLRHHRYIPAWETNIYVSHK